MKSYLATTAALFSLVAVAHVARSVGESARFASDPWFWLEGPGLGLIAAVLAAWGWQLFRRAGR